VASEFISDNTTQAKKRGKTIDDSVNVVINGKSFSGWKTVSITKSIESVANSFSLSLHDKFEGLRQSWPIRSDIPLNISIGKERVLTGVIEQTEPSFSVGSRSFSVAGRSNAGDLVDCSHTGESEFNNVFLDKLAEELVGPFGIKVFLSVEPKKIDKFAVKPGEKVFEALDRAARLQGFFWVSTRGGNIRLTRAARARAFSSLQEGVNLIGGNGTFNSAKRHSEYVVRGQASGVSGITGISGAQVEGTAKDSGVSRHRPLIVLAEGAVDTDKAKTRAQWEASNRLAMASRMSVSVQGWRQENGELWGVNQLTRLKSRTLGVDQDVLIVGLTHKKAISGGTSTDLTLVDSRSYDPKPNFKKEDDLLSQLGVNI